jgi:hypothetical protein
MQIISLIYILLIPLLVIGAVVWASNLKGIYSKCILQVMNILLFIYAVYQIRLLIGVYQFFRSFNVGKTNNEFWIEYMREPVSKIFVAILLPLLFIIPFIRKSLWFSLGVMVYFLSYISLPELDSFEWIITIAEFMSLFSLVYAIFWLKKWLPINHFN